MSKILKRVNMGFGLLSGDDLASLWMGRPNRRYAKGLSNLDLPIDYKDAVERDMKNLYVDSQRSLNK